jgi:solute:Na+ symporter, SSS family
MLNAVCKIPMQFGILLLGVIVLVFDELEQPPLFFDATFGDYIAAHKSDSRLMGYQADFRSAHTRIYQSLETWLKARHSSNLPAARGAFASALIAHEKGKEIRDQAAQLLSAANPGPKEMRQTMCLSPLFSTNCLTV